MIMILFELNKLTDDDRVSRINIIRIICGRDARVRETCKRFGMLRVLLICLKSTIVI